MNLKHKSKIISIDGPAGSGKSTTARLVAKRLGFIFLDTGAMYRALTLKALHLKIDLENQAELSALIKDTEIKLFENNGWLKILLDNEDVTKKIRNKKISVLDNNTKPLSWWNNIIVILRWINIYRTYRSGKERGRFFKSCMSNYNIISIKMV